MLCGDIVEMLSERPRAVVEIAAAMPVSRPAVSKHLTILQDAGLIAHRSRGTRNLYHLEPRGFEAANAWLDSFWDDALARFRLVAENTDPDTSQ